MGCKDFGAVGRALGTPGPLGGEAEGETAQGTGLCPRSELPCDVPRGAPSLTGGSRGVAVLCLPRPPPLLRRPPTCLGSGGRYCCQPARQKPNRSSRDSEQVEGQRHQTCGWPPSRGLHGRGQGRGQVTVPEVYPGGRSLVTHVPPKAGIPLSPVDGGLGRWTHSQVPSVFTVAPGSSVQQTFRLRQFRAISFLRWWPVLGAPAPAPDLLVQKPWAVDERVRMRGELLFKAQERQGTRVGPNWGACSSDGLRYHLWVREDA